MSTAILIGFIVSLLGVIYREITTSRDKQIADRDKRIEKLEQSIDDMAERSSSLATSADRMLTYFLEREELARGADAPPSSRERRSP